MKLISFTLAAGMLIGVSCKKTEIPPEPYRNTYFERTQSLVAKAIADPSDKTALNILKQLTTDGDYWNRFYAYASLQQLAVKNVGGCQDELIPYFEKELRDSDPGIRRSGAEAILDVGSEAIDKTLPTLMKIVGEGNEDDVTWFSTMALGKSENREQATNILTILIKAASTPPPANTQEEAPQVRYYALDSIRDLTQRHQLGGISQLENLLNISALPYKKRVARTILELDPNNQTARQIVGK